MVNKFENVTVSIEDRKSKNGNQYSILVMTLEDGTKCDLAFVNAYLELALLKLSMTRGE